MQSSGISKCNCLCQEGNQGILVAVAATFFLSLWPMKQKKNRLNGRQTTETENFNATNEIKETTECSEKNNTLFKLSWM